MAPQQDSLKAQPKLAPIKCKSVDDDCVQRCFSAQSCPGDLSVACDEAACWLLLGREGPELVKCISAPAVMTSVLQWPGADIKVKNTFLHVEMEDGDEELEFLQACRRRDTQSCPFLDGSTEPALENSPQLPTKVANFDTEPAMEPSPEQTAIFHVPLDETPIAIGELNDPFRNLMACAVAQHHSRRQGSVAGAVSPCSRAGYLLSTPATPAGFVLSSPCSADFQHSTVGESPQGAWFHPDSEPEQEPGLPSIVAYSQGAFVANEHSQTISSRASRRNRPSRKVAGRLWCHILIDTCMLETGFDLVKKLIGKSGCNTRGIFEATNTKIRVRGQGSGHLEFNGREAPVPLMLALAADQGDVEGFSQAFLMTKKLLQDVCQKFVAFYQRKHHDAVTRPLFTLREISKSSLSCLTNSDLDGMSFKGQR